MKDKHNSFKFPQQTLRLKSVFTLNEWKPAYILNAFLTLLLFSLSTDPDVRNLSVDVALSSCSCSRVHTHTHILDLYIINRCVGRLTYTQYTSRAARSALNTVCAHEHTHSWTIGGNHPWETARDRPAVDGVMSELQCAVI